MSVNLLNKVFRRTANKSYVICPPEQVFINTDFSFLLTIGHHLVENEKEFESLKVVLRNMGESCFYILENIGATETDREVAFQATIPFDCTYTDFQNLIESIDPPFGWSMNHFYVFGEKNNWGIYISEHPTINIIGCDSELAESFRAVFGILGNGYFQLKTFLDQEFRRSPVNNIRFISEYKLES